MPLGYIHLIQEETATGAGAVYFCATEDAIAAMHPKRLKGIPRDMICPRCLSVYESNSETTTEAEDT
jgi:hypothetical protein